MNTYIYKERYMLYITYNIYIYIYDTCIYEIAYEYIYIDTYISTNFAANTPLRSGY